MSNISNSSVSEPLEPGDAPLEPANAVSERERYALNSQQSIPPKWLVERWFDSAGGLPASIGKQLDRVARIPFIGWGVQFFSSVWMRILWIFLVGCYIGIGSGLPQVRAHYEMTDLEFFDAWPMIVLLALLTLSLVVVTLRKIRLTLFTAGVWTVHIGILILISGCFIYFSQKNEGTARIFLGQTVDSYYDATERALYVYDVNAAGQLIEATRTMTPLPRLPIYREHSAATGEALSRDVPPEALAAVPKLKDVALRITGYYPFAEMRQVGWQSGKPEESGAGPAVAFVLQRGPNVSPKEWLFGLSPAGRVAEHAQLPFAVEYLYHPTPERVREVEASFESTSGWGLTVRVPKVGSEITFAAEKGKPIVIDGTGGTTYTLTPDETMTMPMASKGYEGAQSSALTVKVMRKSANGTVFKFDRMAMFRYPERSPDFVEENGKRLRKQDGVDPDIQMIFHDASQQQFWFIEDANAKLTLVSRAPGGAVKIMPMEMAQPVPMQIHGMDDVTDLQLILAQQVENAVPKIGMQIIDPRARPRSLTPGEVIKHSMLRLELTRGEYKTNDILVPFAEYASTAEPPVGKPATIVDVSGIGRLGLVFSTTRRELPSTIKLVNFEPVKYKGAMQTYEDYRSTIEVTDKDTGKKQTLLAHLNSPAADHGLYYFQAFWDGNDDPAPGERYSILGVGNRPGIWVMILGAALVIAGTAYAFYVKPVLKNIKKEQLAAWAAERMTR